MKQQAQCDEAEMKALADVVPVKVLRNDKLLAEYVKEKHLSNMELAQILTYTAIRFPEFRQIDIATDKGITFGELFDYYERARLNFIIIRRVNFLVHQSMINVYELLEKEKRLRFGAKKHSKDAEKTWKTYEDTHRKQMPQDAWYVLQDHFVVTEDMLSDRIEKVYTALRDYMIQMGWRDVELKARIELVFLLYKVVVHTFNHFFEEYVRICGVDFSRLFSSSDMRLMVKYFAVMSESLGVRLSTDKYGLYEVEGVSIGKNLRVMKAWNDFIEKLEDEDLMDESARKAIELNPKIAEDYRMAIEDADRKRMESQLTKLGEKFKVTRNKK